METGKSITFTKQEIINQLKPIIIDMLKDNVEGLVNGEEQKMFDHFANLSSKSNEMIADFWCDMVSDVYFNDNPEVDEVLMLVEKLGDGTKIKMWLASK